MQWNTEENAGFTKGKPWIKVCDRYKEINVKKALEDKNSIFYHYKKLLKIRKNLDVICYGTYETVDMNHPNLYVYKRKYINEEVLVLCDFYGVEVEYDMDFSKYELINSNYGDEDKKIRPYEGRVYKLK